MVNPRVGAVLIGLGLMAATQPLAQEDLRQEIEDLKKGQQQILQQLQELKQLLQQQAQARPAAPNVKDVAFDLGNNLIKGDDKAKLILIEFTDYQ